MEKDLSLLRPRAEALLSKAREFLDLLNIADQEADQLPEGEHRENGKEFTTLWVGNISRFVDQLADTIKKEDPSRLWGAAGNFADLGRYYGDYDHSWFSRDGELHTALMEVSDCVGPVRSLYRTTNPASLEAARKALAK